MIIQKFGGVAMQNEAMRLKCINHIKEGLNEFGDVVVVVSAIGRYGDPYSTDSLLQLTDAFSSSAAASDLAASCGELIAAAVIIRGINTCRRHQIPSCMACRLVL